MPCSLCLDHCCARYARAVTFPAARLDQLEGIQSDIRPGEAAGQIAIHAGHWISHGCRGSKRSRQVIVMPNPALGGKFRWWPGVRATPVSHQADHTGSNIEQEVLCCVASTGVSSLGWCSVVQSKISSLPCRKWLSRIGFVQPRAAVTCPRSAAAAVSLHCPGDRNHQRALMDGMWERAKVSSSWQC